MPVIPIIWYIRAAVLAAILGGVWWFSHARYAAGEAAGRAQVQADWDAAVKVARAAVAEAEAKKAAKEAADRKAAQEVDNGLRERLAGAEALARDTARRLQDARARAGRCAVPGSAAPAGEPAPSGGEPADGATLDRADEDHHAACARDAQALNAWVDWCDAVKCWAPR